MTQTEGITLPDKKGESLKSLGVMQADGILLHTKMKDKIRKDNLWRVRKVAQSKPNGGNLMQAINNLAVSLVRYAEAIIDWKKQELKRFIQVIV